MKKQCNLIMNSLLENYCASVEFPDVSGAEHLEMLQIRDRLAESESQLSEEEKILLTKADRQLIEQVNVFYQELSRFVNLAEIRKAETILPQRWWWYLDVLVFLPISLKSELYRFRLPRNNKIESTVNQDCFILTKNVNFVGGSPKKAYSRPRRLDRPGRPRGPARGHGPYGE